MKPYAISSPPFDITSGGIRVMWGLYGWLLAKGQIVFMNQYPTNQDFIAIYPEIVNGNPMRAKTVVRYMLNKAGVMGGVDQYGNFTAGPTEFDKTDKLYYFSRIFGKAQDDNHYMFLPIINTHLFKDQGKQRTKTCYLIGKGTNRHEHPKDAVELTRAFATDQQALADLLNECTVLYCYDKLSAMMEIARLCGCKVKYYGDYIEEDLEKYEPTLNGIGLFGHERKLDTEAFRDHYLGMVDLFSKRLDTFIEETQQ